MKINPMQYTNFKGYSAGKIKALYMQNPTSIHQVAIYEQLRAIGKKEGFDVFMHDNKDIHKNPIDTPSKKYNPWSIWSQDNKFFIKSNNQKKLITSQAKHPEEHLEVESLSQKLNIKLQDASFWIDGGNFFIGENDKQEKYMITSFWAIYLCAAYEYLLDKNIENLDNEKIKEFYENGILYNEKGEIIASGEEYNENAEKWKDVSIKDIAKTLGIKEENIYIIPEIEYHIDLGIRPLNYPYVLVGDDEEAYKMLSELKERFSQNKDYLKIIKNLENKIKERQENYPTSESVCKSLALQGFIPIKVAGNFGRSEVNFINSIVHKNDKGLVYITNSTKHSTPVLEAMEELFEKDLREKCPQISKIYFVSGTISDTRNSLMMYLSELKGGIHCLCCEEMK